MRRLMVIIIGLLCHAACFAADIYESPKNLEVLSKDISPADLRDTMKKFSLGTGFRCSSCHLGEENQPLTEYDFAADDKPLKDRARAMLKMTQQINKTISANANQTPVAVECMTCHRGISKPIMLGPVLVEAAEDNGVQGLQDKYQQLRDRYYGTHSYDFSGFTLSELAQQRALAGHNDQAYAVLDILIEEYPKSFEGHFLYGELASREGKSELAKEYYEKAIQLNPDAAGFVKARIDQLAQ